MMRLICSLKSVRSSFDMIEGLVVIPAGKPRRNASSISIRFAESTKIFIPLSPQLSLQQKSLAKIYLIDSHFISLTANAGCDTIRCQMTAWNASVWGVTVLLLTVGTITHASATFAV